MSFQPGSTVIVKAKGLVGQDGTLVIGCKSFTDTELDKYADEYEIIYPPKPKPVYQPGDYVTDANGASYVRKGSPDVKHFWQLAYNHQGTPLVRDSDPVEPLTLVARGGKPVDNTPLKIGDRVTVKSGARYYATFAKRESAVNRFIYDLSPDKMVIAQAPYDNGPNFSVGGYLVLPEYLERVTA